MTRRGRADPRAEATIRPPEPASPLDAPDRDASDAHAIVAMGLGFWASKVLMTAIDLGVFARLAAAPADLETLRGDLQWHARAARDFLDALVALRLLDRREGLYASTRAARLFLDPAGPASVGAMLDLANARLYGLHADMLAVLKTGQRRTARPTTDPVPSSGYLEAMRQTSTRPAAALASAFDWSRRRTFVDVGSAQGVVAAALVRAHPHLRGIGFDREPLRASFEAFATAEGVPSSLRFEAGDALTDPLPQADVVLIAHLLHELSGSQKMQLLRTAFDALPAGGALIVLDALIDDDRSEAVFALLLSLNTMVETAAGSCYTSMDCQSWMRAAGFATTSTHHLVGPDFMVVGVR